METVTPKMMRLRFEGNDEKKLEKLAEVSGITVPVLASRILGAAMATLPSDHITFPLSFEIKQPKKAA